MDSGQDGTITSICKFVVNVVKEKFTDVSARPRVTDPVSSSSTFQFGIQMGYNDGRFDCKAGLNTERSQSGVIQKKSYLANVKYHRERNVGEFQIHGTQSNQRVDEQNLPLINNYMDVNVSSPSFGRQPMLRRNGSSPNILSPDSAILNDSYIDETRQRLVRHSTIPRKIIFGSVSQCYLRISQVDTQPSKFEKALNNLFEKNENLRKLSLNEIQKIFDVANEQKGYTRQSQPPKNTKNGELMRKFSVAFQKECFNAGLMFSNTNNINKNGMRTKSANKFVENHKINLEEALKNAGWENAVLGK